MWPENLSLAGRGLCLRAAGKHVPAGRIRCQSAQWSNNFLNGPIPPHGYCHFTNLGYNDIQFDMRYDWNGQTITNQQYPAETVIIVLHENARQMDFE